MTTYQTLLLEQREETLIIYLNRPDALNALNALMFDELHAFFSKDYSAYTFRTIIISGQGEKAFAAGADIKELHGLDSARAEALSRKGQRIFTLIEEFHVPVFAAVNGFALGGGCELAMACHFRIASTKAKFGQPEVNLGIIPGYGGTQRLVRLMGKGRAMELLLTGDMITADVALQTGLVNHVTEPDDLLYKSLDIAKKINTKGPLALQGVIKCVNGQFVSGVDGYALEARTFGEIANSEDFHEGTSAFIEKRKANFTGK